MIRTWLPSTSAASTDHTTYPRMAEWCHGERHPVPRLSDLAFNIQGAQTTDTWVRKAILETPAETDSRDSEPCRQILTSHSLMYHVLSMAVTASSKRRRSSTVQRRPATAAWELGTSCRRPTTGLAKSSRTRGGQFQKSNLQGQSRPSTSARDHPWPLAQPIFPVVPRVETPSTLGPWNPGPGEGEVLQPPKNAPGGWLGSGPGAQHCTAPAVARARADCAPSLGVGR